MLQGYNENVVYRGETYHVQTEDGGERNPVITTLVFKGGAILASKKTSYADIVGSDKLGQALREIMSEQHGELIAAVKAGRFDGRREDGAAPAKGAAGGEAPRSRAGAVGAAPPASRKEKQSEAADNGLDEVIMKYLSLDGDGS
ncbi:MAG TPA: hypothetical protein ENJ37_09300 [Deltaproteobacteria bacterium]|nr:hypothetical protein [Deltaproteobacteria bacterium]